MANNIEKFNISRSMQEQGLNEGMLDYEDEKIDTALEEECRIDGIVSAIHKESLETQNLDDFDRFLSEKLKQYSKDEKVKIFKHWFEIVPEKALAQVEKFSPLPLSFQKDIAEYLVDSINPDVWVYHKIISAFNKITDYRLNQLLINSESITFSFLAENKDKFLHISDEKILERAREKSYSKEWYNWSKIIPYIDRFPSVDRLQAIEGVFKQRTNSDRGVLIRYRDKLNISMRELIDIFQQHGNVYELCGNLCHIDQELHQEIADKTIKEKNYWSILQNINEFQNIDALELIKRIANNEPRSSKDGVAAIIKDFQRIPSIFISQIPQDLLDEIMKRDSSVVAYRVNEFGDRVNKDELINTLFEEKKFNVLVGVAEKMGHEKNEIFASRIIEAGGASMVIRHLHEFTTMSRSIYLKLIRFNPSVSLEILKFTGITKDDVYQAVMMMGSEGDNCVNEILTNPTKIEGLCLNQEFANILAQGAGYNQLLRHLEEFRDIDFIALVKQMIASGKLNLVVNNVEKFNGIDYGWLAEQAIKGGCGVALIYNYDNFHGLNDSLIVRELMQQGGAMSYNVAQNIDVFKDVSTDRDLGEKLFKECLGCRWSCSVMARLHGLYTPSIDQIFTLAYNLLGDQLTPESYKIINNIKNNNISKEQLKLLGITKTGETGINQLKQRLSRFKSEILSPDFDASIIKESDFYRQFYKTYVRFNESDWGEHDEQSFEQIIETNEQLRRENKLQPIHDSFFESDEIRIAKVDQEKQKAFKYSEQFLNRYGVLQTSIRAALHLFEQKSPFSHLVEKMEIKRTDILKTLNDKLYQLSRPEAIDSLKKRIEALKGLDLRMVNSYNDNFETLSQFGEFHEELRQLIFYYALHKNKTYREPAYDVTQREKPKFDDIAWMINFIDHIANEETWSKYFIDDKAVKAFRKLVNVNALNEEFSRAQNQSSNGTTALEFIPTRGLMMEFSGHIADACWASKYESISEKFHNFTTVVMVQNRNTKHERLAGACMLIEALSQSGEPLLIIRGLNPIENVINSLSVEDFFNKFTSYIGSIAKKMKRQLAIVIDDHAGGSASNRPVLFQYLIEKKKVLKHTKLVSEKDTSFNDYNIINDTYIIE